jgi:hypothetical protein
MMDATTRRAILTNVLFARDRLTQHKDIHSALELLERIEMLCRAPEPTNWSDSATILGRESQR